MNCHVPSVPCTSAVYLSVYGLTSLTSQWSCHKQCLSCLSFWPKAPELNAPVKLHVFICTSSNGKKRYINPDRHSLDLALLAPFSIKLTRVNDAMASKAAKVEECSWLKTSLNERYNNTVEWKITIRIGKLVWEALWNFGSFLLRLSSTRNRPWDQGSRRDAEKCQIQNAKVLRS